MRAKFRAFLIFLQTTYTRRPFLAEILKILSVTARKQLSFRQMLEALSELERLHVGSTLTSL